jgi:DNA-binding NarL/FixJ family response regulator
MGIYPKVAILTGRSLFTDGFICRLKRSIPLITYEVIDERAEDAMQRIVAYAPDIVVMDQQDPAFISKLHSALYPVIPHLKMIIVEPQADRARVIQWAEFPACKVGDILNMINNLAEGDQNPAPEFSR